MRWSITLLAYASLAMALTACSGKKSDNVGTPPSGDHQTASSKPNPWSSDAPPAEPAKAAEPAAKSAEAKPKKNPWAKDTAPQADEAAAEKPAE